MSESTQFALTSRDCFLQSAKREMEAFERREREFRRRVMAERAAELRMPVTLDTVH